MRSSICAAALGLASWAGAADGPPPLPAADPDIVQMLGDISAERIQRSVFVLSSFKTRHTLSDPDPSADGIGAAAGWVRTQMQKPVADAGGRLSVTEDSFIQPAQPPGLPQEVRITNLVAKLAGARAGSARRIFVVCAHYDSRVSNPLDATSPSPGADDDASGVAAVLELERVMSKVDFPATIVFLITAGEEQGLYGSAHWARRARLAGDEIEGVLNDDIIGSSHGPNGTYEPHTVRLFVSGVPPASRWTPDDVSLIATGGQNDLPPRQLARAIVACAKVYRPAMDVRLIYRADRYLRSGDQNSFLDQGYAAVRFTEAWEDYDREHQDVRPVNGVLYGDVPDALDYVYLADVTRVNAAALGALARAPAPPRGAVIETARLENATTLRWQPNHEPDLAGYRILWRDTASPAWQHWRDLPTSSVSVTLPVDKDDVVFGLEAFDDAGHISLAVCPQPPRIP